MAQNHGSDSVPHVYDRALMLHGGKRNEVMTLAEIQRYGIDSFGDPDYVSIYGMRPEEWYSRRVRLLGRTAVECTRDALADHIALDVASVAKCMPWNQFAVIDPFAGSCNTLFWILRRLPNSEGIGFESDQHVFDLTRRNLAAIGQRIEVVHGDYVGLLQQLRVPVDRGIAAFIAPPWGSALDEVQGLDLCGTEPPIAEVIEQIMRQFSIYNVLFAVQVHEKVSTPSLGDVQKRLDWTDLRIYDICKKGWNHGILLGTKGWSPRR